MLQLPTVDELPAQLSEDEISRLSEEVRALAQERDAVILAHNYQLPELQDLADFVGDSLGLSRQAADTDASVIESESEQPARRSGISTVFCGERIEAVSAMKWTPQKAITSASVAAAWRES